MNKSKTFFTLLNIPGRKQIGLLLTLGVRSCSFEPSLSDKYIKYMLIYKRESAERQKKFISYNIF